MSAVLITGAAGFIGSVLCRRLSSDNKVIGVDITKRPDGYAKIIWEQADLTDWDSVAAICEKYSPGVVIHCAGIAHQKIGAVDPATYIRVNSEVTANLAKAATESNSDVCFIFLSSVSVYGEGGQETEVRCRMSEVRRQETEVRSQETEVRRQETEVRSQETEVRRQKTEDRSQETGDGRTEDGECNPSSDYAYSKLDAERRLTVLFDGGMLRNLIILRLAPVYDREWSLNLDRRVFAPGKLAYLRFGSGSQKMSALARPNLVDFINHILQSTDLRLLGLKRNADSRRLNPQVSTAENNLCNRRNLRINVCDAEPYSFNRIIQVFKQSDIHPNRPVIPIPLSFVWLLTRIAGFLLPKKRKWLHSGYEKLASDLVFDNGRMMGTGFRPKHSLETILAANERR